MSQSTTGSSYEPSPEFRWDPGYEAVLEQIIANDITEPCVEWEQFREMIKFKVEQNIAMYLSHPGQHIAIARADLPMGTQDNAGNMSLPPFPPRERGDEKPKVYMNEEEASKMKMTVFKQLHEFDDAPFTIQRICELCMCPTRHYSTVGKYLRAVEKSLLVTSSWNSFPVEEAKNGHPLGGISVSQTVPSVPTTPIFSPIPFLHGDARRSKSCSPPPSPFILGGMEAPGHVEPLGEGMGQRAIGLVDELDDPRPGHMSEHPTPITSVTMAPPPPFLESLEDRFVRGGQSVQDGAEMTVDPSEDNK